MGFGDFIYKRCGVYEPVEGDYKVNGIWYCGTCHTPCEGVMLNHEWLDEWKGEGVKYKALCRCKSSAKKAESIRYDYITKRDDDRRNIMAGYKDYRFDNLPEEIKKTEMFKKIKKYVNRFETILHDKENKAIYNMGLYFYGTLGNGKTTVAATMANELIDRGYSVCLISMNEAIKSTTGFKNGSKVKQLIKNVDLLILDDYGKDSGSDYNVQNVYNIINARYSVHRPLIVTTNFNKEDLQDPTSPYHASNDRLLEMTYGIGFMGNSKRAEISKQKGEQRTNWLNN